MWIKRFRAGDLGGALGAVREEFGPEALILSTQQVRTPGLIGVLRRRVVEVTAAIDPTANLAPNLDSQRREPSTRKAVGRFLDELERIFPGDKPYPEPAVVPSQNRSVMDGGVAETPTSTEPVQAAARSRLYNALTVRGVPGVIARKLVNEAARRLDAVAMSEPARAVELLRGQVREDIVRVLGASRPLPETREDRQGPIVAVMVGPTGVGKTTTIAKLAARYALEKGWSVELLTCDTFRVAAIDQLAQYGELMGIPAHVARSPEEAAAFVEGSQADLVLVDTAGRNHLDDNRMEDVAALLKRIQPAHAFLCVSLTSRDRDAIDIVERYSRIGVNRLILTKLDETCQPGLSVSLAARASLPLSYVTTGQQVPDDLLVCDPVALATQVVGEDS